MEMKYVVPDMAQSFGTLEFAGESQTSHRLKNKALQAIGTASTAQLAGW